MTNVKHTDGALQRWAQLSDISSLVLPIPGGRPLYIIGAAPPVSVVNPERFGPWETRKQWREWVRRFVEGTEVG